ncbi:lipid IV(A) 3-deoxy-D-manno-octulosonic acid transferase [Blochmannia endosymbiont of Camponotus sp. C-003]|uniref:lipid IV(A) 3-deoxy-D-manno-octulosonic acid transferase n=1 Tax=unclassified Candidatus Blochmanniella TaxID=711328 RepID=UPI0020241C68|nr:MULTISPECIES: lipid IV(A) 3-deoxy-D-manno-octulosonic acid transferase [unclassified Candidatus Blochmannia]URJ23247.1 lipid IV(A) 3-deoxy-D-manno-octulosonic acid transferase [Blochmannia endosymbiont of Camponotus sp. C-003]URJ28716.1 lipid IV(A) 3-deoxy-D-manno-octulosonic acid transferase [Blochmannia endosymbiont of Camponotus sp. C-046]
MFKLYIAIYSIIMYVAQPIIWIRLLWRSRRSPSYRKHWLERYGFYKKPIQSDGIILHAVSLGETLAAIPLIRALQQRYPEIAITLTAMTPTGIELARSKFHHNAHCSYLPYDLPGAMKRFIDQVKPRLVITMETELWPNLINILYQREIPFIIANARLSFRSFIKYKRFSHFISLIMERITLIAAQNKEDASRFLKLGLKKNQLFVMGNLKCDIEMNQDLLNKISFLKKNWIKKRKVWIASSTHAGEEILLLKAHKHLLARFPDLLMILAPRHPERFVDVKNITEQAGFSYIMRSSGIIPSKATQVIINDTIGELMLLYGVSDIAFIGGSLVKHGGHNPLEPAAHSIPLIMGPYTFNFNDICVKLYKSNGLITVTDTESLVKAIAMLLVNQQCRLSYGCRAMKVLQNNQGALQQLLYLLDKTIY